MQHLGLRHGGEENPKERQGFECSTRVATLNVGPDTALLHQRDGAYQLLHLNDTANLIWQGLATGLGWQQVAQTLEELGAPADQAREFVDAQIGEWLKLGFLVPLGMSALLSTRPTRSLRLALDEMCVEVRLFGSSDNEVERAFAPLITEEARAADTTISVVADLEVDHLFVDGVPLGCAPRRCTVPRLKILVLDEYFNRARSGFCTHAALVSFQQKRVLLTGPPGAGKSTLALALLGEGFAYGGDDTARVGPDGRVKGLPFAATAKAGSWPLLQRWHADIDSLTIHERLDGHLARYVSPQLRETYEYGDLFACFRLERKSGAEAHFEPMRPLDILCTLIESAYTEHPPDDAAPTFSGLAHVLSNALCGRLVYDDLGEVVSLVKTLVSNGARGA